MQKFLYTLFLSSVVFLGLSLAQAHAGQMNVRAYTESCSIGKSAKKVERLNGFTLWVDESARIDLNRFSVSRGLLRRCIFQVDVMKDAQFTGPRKQRAVSLGEGFSHSGHYGMFTPFVRGTETPEYAKGTPKNCELLTSKDLGKSVYLFAPGDIFEATGVPSAIAFFAGCIVLEEK